MAKKLDYSVTLCQGGNEGTFKLTEKEFKAMPVQRHNFAWFAWADYEISRSKRARFNKLFDYHKGDFLVVETSHPRYE